MPIPARAICEVEGKVFPFLSIVPLTAAQCRPAYDDKLLNSVNLALGCVATNVLVLTRSVFSRQTKEAI